MKRTVLALAALFVLPALAIAEEAKTATAEKTIVETAIAGKFNTLVAAAKAMMRGAGYPLVFTQAMGIETNSHQCGTLRFGEDPATSVLDPDCRAHDVENLYVVDSSFFVSSSAMNPALTIAAQALRVAEKISN